jgi:hypothetical protein
VSFALEALEELAIHYEHQVRDFSQAIEFTLAALARLEQQSPSVPHRIRFARRLERLQRKLAVGKSKLENRNSKLFPLA